MKNIFLVLVSYIFLFSLIDCDLPSHCLFSDIEGKWTFYVNQKQFSPSLKDQQTHCGHGFPNTVSNTIGDQMFSPFIQAQQISFILSKDFKVYKNNSQVGTWTPVYDQSFVIYYHDSIITASFKYYRSVNNNTKYETNCGKTMLGWIIENKNRVNEGWSCTYGIKPNRIGGLKRNFFIQTSVKDNRNASFLFEVKSGDLKPMIKEINESNLLWKAKLYKPFKGLNMIELRNQLGLNNAKSTLSLNKSIYEKRNKFKLKKVISLIETTNSRNSNQQYVNNYEDFKEGMKDKTHTNEKEQIASTAFKHEDKTLRKDTHGKLREKDSKYVTDLNEVKMYLNTSIGNIDEDTLPGNWDWRDVGGINYITPVENQGQCGSCYVFATIHSLESRLRIQTDNIDKTRFSIQFPLSCNFYSEGCKGGYPYLVAKFLSEFELVPRDCFPYTQSNSNCNNVCEYSQFTKKYTVDHYGYLGGFYGATNEVMMMKEIRARGPIPGNMKVPIAFNFYSSGIFSMKEILGNSNRLNKSRIIDSNLSFETVEHSVTLIGYGIENGVKYWIGKNTWGENWGENGYFKILRGENEQNIESMGDYFTILVTNR